MKLIHPLILASASPRRSEILQMAGFSFEKKVKTIDEHFPETMPVLAIAEYLANRKLAAFNEEMKDNLVLCADTVVIIEGKVLNKPADALEARAMLNLLSGKTHQVATGIALGGLGGQTSATDVAEVRFKNLTEHEIEYYIKACQPFDKAGAYGIQDFIGMIGIEHIEGSFYTVMGLPIHRVYQMLQKYISW